MFKKLLNKFFNNYRIKMDELFVKPTYGVSFDSSIKLDELPIIKEEDVEVEKT